MTVSSDVVYVNGLLFSDDVMEFAKQALAPIPEDKMRSATVFGSAVSLSPDASPSGRFLAWTGRDPR